MLYFLFFTLVFIILIALGLTSSTNRKRNPFIENDTLPYQRRPIMSQTELHVYDLLLQSLPNHMIFAQVQASRIIAVPKGKKSLYWFNFISRLSYDFVICRPNGTPIAAIEIDDRSHNAPKRIATDLKKNKATETAGIAILRWPVNNIPPKHHIHKLITQIDKKAA